MSQAAEPPRLTREQAVEFLNESGYPITSSTFRRLSMPSRGGGPRVDYIFGHRTLYRTEDLIEWARARSRPRAA